MTILKDRLQRVYEKLCILASGSALEPQLSRFTNPRPQLSLGRHCLIMMTIFVGYLPLLVSEQVHLPELY